MASVNRMILIGNLCADPEVRFSSEGKATCALRLATNERYTDKSGEKVEKSEFHRVVFFGKPAEILGEYAKKGGQLYIEGKLSTRKWQDKQGQDRYTTEVIGDRFQFLGSREGGQAASSGGSAAVPAPQAKERVPARSGGFDEMDDDIPF